MDGRSFGVAAFAAWIALGCLQVTTDTGAGGEGGAGGGGEPLVGTDEEICGKACATLVGCGVELDQQGCKEQCLDASGATFLACAKQSTASCNPLAMCSLAELCDGAVPSGSASCQAAQDCAVGNCTGNPSSCGCSCASQMSASEAIDFYALVVCSSVHCSIECDVTGDPTSCASCLENECASADAQCQ